MLAPLRPLITPSTLAVSAETGIESNANTMASNVPLRVVLMRVDRGIHPPAMYKEDVNKIVSFLALRGKDDIDIAVETFFCAARASIGIMRQCRNARQPFTSSLL